MARPRAVVDLPVPDGPSTATTPRSVPSMPNRLPNVARTPFGSPLCPGRTCDVRPVPGDLQPDGLVERADLVAAELAQGPGALLAEADVAHRGAHEALDGLVDGLEQAPDDVLAALVPHDLDHH